MHCKVMQNICTCDCMQCNHASRCHNGLLALCQCYIKLPKDALMTCALTALSADDADPVNDEDNPAQESFFSQVGQRESHWFHLSAASNHFQSSDSLSTGGTPSCSSIKGQCHTGYQAQAATTVLSHLLCISTEVSPAYVLL